MASRRLEDLVPEAQEKAREHLLRCADAGIELLIYCTLRDAEEQARLYTQDRTPEQIQAKVDQLGARGFPRLAEILRKTKPQAGGKVTFAGPGESFHQYGRAYDCVPIAGGKAVWQTTGEGAALWQKVGELGKKAGLEWAGDWTKFREFPHFQWTAGQTLDDLMQERFGPAPAAPAASAAVRSTRATRGLAMAAPGPAAAPTAGGGESDALRAALAEPNTVFLVFGVFPGSDAAAVAAKHQLALETAQSGSPAVWRSFLVRDPAGLDADLSSLIWPGGEPSPAVLLRLGTGLGRTRAGGFPLEQLKNRIRIALVFSQG